MKITTIDGLQRDFPGCLIEGDDVWLHVTSGGRWVASYLRCMVRGGNACTGPLDDLLNVVREIFGPRR